MFSIFHITGSKLTVAKSLAGAPRICDALALQVITLPNYIDVITILLCTDPFHKLMVLFIYDVDVSVWTTYMYWSMHVIIFGLTHFVGT